MESVQFVKTAAETHDVVIFDRYIASNMVYQGSKVSSDHSHDLMSWIWRLEVEIFDVPPPNVSIYLDTSLEHARRLMHLKERRSYTERTLDEHEADLELQERVRLNYAAVAADGHFGDWHVVRSEAAEGLRPPALIVDEIVGLLMPALGDAGQGLGRRLIA